VKPKQLRSIRDAMDLTQAEFAAKLRITRNSVARMERGEMIVTPPMELLISFVAREAGVDVVNPARGRKAAQGKRAHAKAGRHRRIHKPSSRISRNREGQCQ
jgi:transcriptional regulator with XRE-family HTH domain